MHIVVYDIEIAERVYDKPKPGQLGWDDARAGRAGISAVALWDSLTGRPHLYSGKRIAECVEHLNSADANLGWNSDEFDKPAIEGFSGLTLDVDQFDLRQFILHALQDKYAKGYRLGQVCERTLGLAKSGDGAGAPQLAKEERWDELFDYNINDVWLTMHLHNHIVQHGYVIKPDDTRLKVYNPLRHTV